MDFYGLLKEGEFSLNFVAEEYKFLFSLFFYTLIIVAYSIFIWKFYKFISRREIIELNLKNYNRSIHPFFEKTLAIIFYTIEYIVILPFLVIFWFTVFSIMTMILSESLDFMQILIISASVVCSIRITSYINQELSKDIAKIIPLTLLALFVLNTKKIFDFNGLLIKLYQIPSFLNNIFIFLMFLITVEFILRVFYSVFQFFKSIGLNEQDLKQENLKKAGLNQVYKKPILKKLENYR